MMYEQTAHVMKMKSYFGLMYAKAIYDQLDSVVKQQYYGCEVDHPSQVQHNIMLETKEHTDMYFDQLLSSVSENEIYLSCCEIMEALCTCPELFALQKLKLCDDEWLTTMKTDAWKSKMRRMVLKIA